jgi:hypothetical protein
VSGHVLQHACAEHCANTVAKHCKADAIPCDSFANDDIAFICTNWCAIDARPVAVADVGADCRVLRGSH